MGRLVIREIVLENFKSYGGRRVIGPFHECFSAIIGPNGSGKSNVIDALMFVFGKKAKKIRLSKLSELIHNPQNGAERPSFARVEVVFHEIQDVHPGVYETVPGSDLVVSRDVSQNNASKYCVNGKGSSWTEVTALFSGKGIDLEHNRFLILQGEVEQIAMMKPMGDGQHEEGLLDYLEDLIGSNRYIAEIGEKSAEFATFSETRNEHLHRVKQAEKEKDQLEGPRQEAEMYVRAATELLEAKSTLLMIQRYQVDLKIDAARIEVNETAAELDRVNELVDKETVDGKKIEVLYEEKKREKDSTKILMDKASAGFKSLDEIDAVLHARIKLTTAAIEKETKSIDTEKKLIEKLTFDLTEMTHKIVQIDANIGQIDAQLSVETQKLEVLFESVHSVTFALKGRKESKEVEQGDMRAQVDKLTGEKKILQAERQVLLDKQKSAEDILEKNEKGLRKLVTELNDRTAGLREARETSELYEKKLAETAAEMMKKNREYELGLNAVTAAKQKVEAAKSQLESLAEGGRGGGAFVTMHNRIRAEVDRGKLRGVLGRLGDLGDVDEKFLVAFNVALSAQMEALVVTKTSDAQAVVEFVKKANLGRVTCIILEKVQSSTATSSTQLPRMVDLINAPKGGPLEDRVRDAFFFAIRDTLVAENIEEATRVGLGGDRRFRVVTLGGQLVDPSGAMTGGGSTTQLRKNSRQVVEAAEKDVEREAAKFGQLSAEFENLRNEKHQLFAQRDALEKSLDQFKTVIGNSDEIVQLEEQLAAEKLRIASLPVVSTKLSETELRSVAEFGEKIAICETHLAPKLGLLQSVEAEISELTNQIVAIAGEKTRKQKSVVDQIVANLETKKSESSRAQVDKNKVESKIGKAQKSVTESTQELGELTQRLSKEQTELVEIEKKAEEVLSDFNKFKAQTDRIAIELMELEKTHATFKARINELRKKNLDILNEIEKLESVKKEFETKSKEFSKQINSVRKEWKALPHELLDEASPVEETKSLGRDLTREELESLSPVEVQTTLVRLEARMTKLHPNVKAIEEYREKLAEFKSKMRELETVCEQREECRKKLEFLRQERLSMFMSGFNIISLKVKEMYQMLTLGGDAELELVDSTDPFAKGISFSVRPPKKTWKAITQLSGGEKTLSSLSLVFALHYFKPTPLYFLDEIDAALDSRNVAIISNYIKQRATDAQFIIISLRNQMFEIADWLVGIYKTDHISKSVTLDPGAASAFQPNQQRPFYATPERAREETPQRGS